MCGFEFVTTIMLSAEVPVLYYFLRDWPDKTARRRWLRMGLWVGLLQMGAFAGALLVWMIQLTVYHGDLQMALETMRFTATKHTGFWESIPLDDYFQSLDRSRIQAVKVYMVQQPMWGNCSVRTVLLAVFGVTAVNGMLAKQPWQKTFREILFLGACAIPPMSWYFLAITHSYLHLQIDFLLWGFPFLPLVTAFMVQSSVEVFVRLWKWKPPLRIGNAGM